MFVPIALILAATPPATTPPATPVAAAAKPGSLQAAFDAATAAYESGKWSEAVTLFDALEARVGKKASAQVRGTIALRRGLALKRLDQYDRAEKSLREALALIPSSESKLAIERLDGQFALANILLSRSDFAGAGQIARDARDAANTPGRQLEAALLGLRSTMFDSGNAATEYAADAERLAAAMPQKQKGVVAEIDTLRARLLLNQGKNPAAYALLKKALVRQGGLDTRVTLSEVVTRSDLAIAALLNGDKEGAREYLAYTGAGRITQSPFDRASSMAPPPCGGTAGLNPDDTAIVEFGIDAVGAVSYAQTVYMSRPSPIGAKVFSQAVLGWSWQPGALVKIPAFYKMITRVELRCSNAVSRPSIGASLGETLNDYVKAHIDDIASFGLDAASLPNMQAELARREAKEGDPAVPALMIAISMNAASTQTDARRMLERAQSLLSPDARVILKASVAYVLVNMAARQASSGIDTYRSGLRTLLARPDFAADPVVAATLRLTIAEARYQKPAPADAIALVTAVVDDVRLEKDHPLKTASLLRLATLQAQAKQIDAASATFARTGLTPDQCALLDTPAAVAKSNVDSGDFPMEAQQWGFEGWARFEQDILADGRTSGTRVVIAYPPFVFRDAAVKVGAGMRYQTTFRPGSIKGCAANQMTLRFSIAK